MGGVVGDWTINGTNNEIIYVYTCVQTCNRESQLKTQKNNKKLGMKNKTREHLIGRKVSFE